MILDVARWIKSCCGPTVGVGLSIEEGDLERAADQEDLAAMPPSFAPMRRTTFLLGRAAARAAMSDLGLPPLHLPRAASGAPQWPTGLVGSISHTNSRAVAVTGRKSDFGGLGVDMEQTDRRAVAGILDRILTPQERARGLGSNSGRPIDDLRVFCAKEAAFKALAAHMPQGLGFWDISLSPAVDGRFQATLELTTDLPPCAIYTSIISDHLFAIAAVLSTHAPPRS